MCAAAAGVLVSGCAAESDVTADERTGLESPATDETTGEEIDETADGPTAAATDELTQAGPTIHMVYLSPTDRGYRSSYATAMRRAAENVRLWYGAKMGGRTFRLRSPVVEWYRTAHAASWYSANNRARGANVFWDNVLADASSVVRWRFNDPNNVWVFYAHADNACGQNGGLGTSGVVVMAANDLRGVANQPRVATCPGDRDSFGLCRWYGGLAHELGHAFNLPHPSGCADSNASTSCPNTVMWTGMYDYPNTGLTSSEREALRRSPFFTVQSVPTTPPACAN